MYQSKHLMKSSETDVSSKILSVLLCVHEKAKIGRANARVDGVVNGEE